MKNYAWDTHFLQLFDRVLDRHQAGQFRWDRDYSPEDLAFLRSIGYQPREFFDFVEDYEDGGEPSPSTAVLIASVRQDYFRSVQKGILSTRQVKPGDLPGRGESLGGFPWLPRIIVKAGAKLRGELDPDIMFACGGDCAFLREHGIHPADFLRHVWAAKGDSAKVVEFVRNPLEKGKPS